MALDFEVVVTRPGTQERHTFVCSGEASIGREPQNAILLAHGFVSRVHAAIKLLDQRTVRITDLGSRNGTIVEGVPLSGSSTEAAMPVTLQVGPFVLAVGALRAETQTMEAGSATFANRSFLDVGRRQFFVDGRPVLENLSQNEFAFLEALSGAAPNVAARVAVGDAIWGDGQWDPYMLHNLVSRLRRRLASEIGDEEIIVTVPAVGFRLN